MLSMNKDNCARFDAEFNEPWSKVEKANTDSFSKLYPSLGQAMAEKGT
jgi:hypothetical protein